MLVGPDAARSLAVVARMWHFAGDEKWHHAGGAGEDEGKQEGEGQERGETVKCLCLSE